MTSPTATWRERARPIIAAVLADAKARELGDIEIRKALRDAYPFGQRKGWPYFSWLDECKVQRGLKAHGSDRRPKHGDLKKSTRQEDMRFDLAMVSVELTAAIEGKRSPRTEAKVRVLEELKREAER